MPELTYDLVAPLVAQTDVSSNYVQVVFQCPVSHELIKSSASATESQGSAMKKEVKRSLWRNIRWSLGRMMYNVFGYGVGGAVGSTLVESVGSAGEASGYQPNEEEVKRAVMDAFQAVGNRFAWDESNQRFVSASVFHELQTEFTVIMQKVLVTKQWDRAVLARMLAEVASADGTLAEEERQLFYSFLRDQNLDALLEKPPLSKADLEETSEDARHVMWLLAAAMAVADEKYSELEKLKLENFGDALGIADKDQARGLELAKEYVLDLALEAAYADGKMDKNEHDKVIQLGIALGIPDDRVARLDARCRKRKGIL
jgi:tellurite resistance protein